MDETFERISALVDRILKGAKLTTHQIS